jgi:hypothetical protein
MCCHKLGCSHVPHGPHLGRIPCAGVVRQCVDMGDNMKSVHEHSAAHQRLGGSKIRMPAQLQSSSIALKRFSTLAT